MPKKDWPFPLSKRLFVRGDSRPQTDAEFEAYFELRWRILRKPWGEARGTEVDELEDTTTHVAAFDEANRLVGSR